LHDQQVISRIGDVKVPEQEAYKITPEDYQSILKDVEIQSISLLDLSYKCERDEITNNQVKLGLKTDAVIEKQENGIAYIVFNFNLTGTINRKNVLKIAGAYLAEFSIVDEMTEEFLEVFKDYSLRLLMTPYLRDLFYNMSMRSNLPGIILPLIKFFPTEKKLT
jgi:preprotein translocase subunit SecB